MKPRGHAENLVRISHDQLRKNISSRKIMRAQNREICNTIRFAPTRSLPAAMMQLRRIRRLVRPPMQVRFRRDGRTGSR
jgi:hypothetical protein